MSEVRLKNSIKGFVFEVKMAGFKSIKEIFQHTLAFDSIFENKSQIVFNNPLLSKSAFIRFSLSNNQEKPLSNEHLLVIYFDDQDKYAEVYQRMSKISEIIRVKANNPYWDKVGATFLINKYFYLVISKQPYQNYKIRFALPVSDLPGVAKFFKNQFNLEQIGSFSDHAGFDGIMMGRDDIDCHLEFTHEQQNKSAEKCEFGIILPRALAQDQHFFRIQNLKLNIYSLEQMTSSTTS